MEADNKVYAMLQEQTLLEQEEELLSCFLDIGQLLLTSGAEIMRVEDTVTRLRSAYGFTKPDVFTITSSIVITVRTPEGRTMTQTRRIRYQGVNLDCVAKGPVLLFLVPMLIPLIPGSDLYYTMSNLVNGHQGRFMHHAGLLMSEAGAIALGIICAAAIARLAMTLFHRR